MWSINRPFNALIPCTWLVRITPQKESSSRHSKILRWRCFIISYADTTATSGLEIVIRIAFTSSTLTLEEVQLRLHCSTLLRWGATTVYRAWFLKHSAHKDRPIWLAQEIWIYFNVKYWATNDEQEPATAAFAAALVTKINHFRQIETPSHSIPCWWDGTLGWR